MVGDTAENLCHGAFADPFIQVVDDLGTAIVEHQLGGSAFRSTDGQSRCFAASERLLRPGRDKIPARSAPRAQGVQRQLFLITATTILAR